MSEMSPFQALGLPEALLSSLQEIGYEAPSPIQAESIPPLLQGRDLLGQAQTGTGKTAAFALPVLARIDLKRVAPQALVLAPTRELAIQVAEAFQSYARHLPGFHVAPVYGGQGYDTQIRQLKRGCHVVVGTPGRLMDHMRKKTLQLDALTMLVLDEADEMLRMGFQEDVEWILSQAPEKRQIALFSATMPREIKRVAETYLHDPVQVRIASTTRTAAKIRQRYWQVSGLHKLDALTRILETESFDGMIIFVRTKTATLELAEKLAARGFSAEAMNGDMAQAHREKLVDRLKDGKLDILVATDVVARGLDVERVSHVINYDIPYDSEAYIHRIGRTGRAGREGDAILFVAPRERRMLGVIEKATGQPIERMGLPTAQDINRTRVERFKQRVREALEGEQNALFADLLNELAESEGVDMAQIAAALAGLLQGATPLLMDERETLREDYRSERSGDGEGRRERSDRGGRDRPVREDVPPALEPLPLKDHPEVAMERYVLDTGYVDGVKPANIVGAIANEADLDSRYIGHIDIHETYTVVDLPGGMPPDLLQVLRKTRICGKPCGLRRYQSEADLQARPAKPSARTTGPREGKSSYSESRAGKPPKGGKAKFRKDNARTDRSEGSRSRRPRAEDPR